MPERVRDSVPGALKDFVRDRIVQKTITGAYDSKLRSGFSEQGLVDLVRVKADAELDAYDRAQACLQLARWHAAKGDFAAALAEMRDRRKVDPGAASTRRQYMLEALFLCQLGRAREARALIERYAPPGVFDASVELMKANTWNPAVTGERTAQAEAAVLDHVNAIYRHFGFVEIAKRDADAPLSIDNLCAPETRAHVDPDTPVTVIVPAYNAAATIATALASLAAQSWRDIEVLVVDDCSTDDTAAVAQAFCDRDPRFRLIRQPANRGSYACRNRALQEARGKFITVHDADDWSHPQRVEQQALALLKSPERSYNLSRFAKATPQLAFFGTWRPSDNLVSLNLSSLMFRREALDRVGLWNEVRIGADREFVKRLDLLLGGDYRQGSVSGCPMAFGRSLPNSLTHHHSTHVRTVSHGVRRTYHEVTDVWHASLKATAAAAAPTVPANLPFPHLIRSVRMPEARLDIVIVNDFNRDGACFHAAMDMLRAARAAGLDVGIFQHFHYDGNVTRPLRSEVIEYAAQNDVRIISAGESVDVDAVVIADPTVLSHRLDMFPHMNPGRLVVLVDPTAGSQGSRRPGNGRAAGFDPAVARRRLVEYFGRDGEWMPLSEAGGARGEGTSAATDIRQWLDRLPRREGAAAAGANGGNDR